MGGGHHHEESHGKFRLNTNTGFKTYPPYEKFAVFRDNLNKNYRITNPRILLGSIFLGVVIPIYAYQKFKMDFINNYKHYHGKEAPPMFNIFDIIRDRPKTEEQLAQEKLNKLQKAIAEAEKWDVEAEREKIVVKEDRKKEGPLRTVLPFQ